MRIFRTLLILTGVVMLLPSPPQDQTVSADGTTAQQPVAASDLLMSATSAFSDVASFCMRQPMVCETAGYLAANLEAKAKYGVRLAYEWANDYQADPALETGSTAPVEEPRGPGRGQSTLTLDDLLPAWKGPANGQNG
jgi:hypothetical protein